MSGAYCKYCYKKWTSDLALARERREGELGRGGQEKEENRADVQGNH